MKFQVSLIRFPISDSKILNHQSAIDNLKSGYPVDSFLTADLHAEAAVDTGQPVDLHATVLSPDHGGALEPLETEPAGHTGADGRHLERRRRTFRGTDAATRAFLVLNDIACFGPGDGSLGALHHAGIALVTRAAVEASLGFRDHRIAGRQKAYFLEAAPALFKAENGLFDSCSFFPRSRSGRRRGPS